MSRGLRVSIAAIGIALCMAFGARAEYPDKPISVVVPYPPGSIADVSTRQVLEIASRQSGWRFVVANRAGAMGTLGASHVAREKPDGYTLLAGSTSELSLVPEYGVKVDFDPQKAFAPITQASRGSMILVVPSSLGVGSVQELIALAKSKKEPLAFGSAGPGSLTFFGGKVFEKRAGIEFNDIHYKSASQALTDLIPGRIQFQFDFVPTSLPFIKDGKIKALLITGVKRAPLLPDVPIAREAGVPELEILVSAGYFAPSGTPVEIVKKLNAVIGAAVRSPENAKALTDQGAEAISGTPEEFATVMAASRKQWAHIISTIGVRAPQQ